MFLWSEGLACFLQLSAEIFGNCCQSRNFLALRMINFLSVSNHTGTKAEPSWHPKNLTQIDRKLSCKCLDLEFKLCGTESPNLFPKTIKMLEPVFYGIR
jgi:hypothetical protein